MKYISQIIVALAAAVCIICAATTITLNASFLYDADIDNYNLTETTGLSRDEIKANYQAMIDYNDLGGPDTLEFPTFCMSDGGRIHFEDVRRIFHAMEYAMIISAVITVAGIIYLEKRERYLYRLLICIFTVALPAVVGIYAALSWDTFFVTFHKLMFSNDYWIFDEQLDPVITILPDGYFLHCVIMIVIIALAAAAVFGFLYKMRYKSVLRRERSL